MEPEDEHAAHDRKPSLMRRETLRGEKAEHDVTLLFPCLFKENDVYI